MFERIINSVFISICCFSLYGMEHPLRISQELQEAHGLLDINSDLLRAVHNNDLATVEQLLQNGAEVNCHLAVPSLITPLHIATKKGNTAMVELLVARGALVNGPQWAQLKPLHIAASNNFIAIAELLLKKGAGVNAQGPQDKTPLIYAVEKGFYPMTLLLLRYNAKPTMTCAVLKQMGENNPPVVQRLNSWDIAYQQGNRALVELLQEWQNEIDEREQEYLDSHIIFPGYVKPISEWVNCHRLRTALIPQKEYWPSCP